MAGHCQYHTKGVPQGTKPGDFYEPGCPKCEDKLRRGLTTPDAPRVLSRKRTPIMAPKKRSKYAQTPEEVEAQQALRKTFIGRVEPKVRTIAGKTPAPKLTDVFVEIPVVGFPGVKL